MQGSPSWLFVIAACTAVLFVLFIFLGIWFSHYVRVNPNQLLVVSGRRMHLPDGRVIGYRVVKGGGTFVMPVVEHAQVISLEVTRVDIPRLKFLARNGSAAQASCAAQVQVKSDEASLETVVQNFPGKSPDQIGAIVRPVLENKAAAALAHATIEEIERDPSTNASRVVAEAGADLDRMGVRLVSFAIENVRTA